MVLLQIFAPYENYTTLCDKCYINVVLKGGREDNCDNLILSDEENESII